LFSEGVEGPVKGLLQHFTWVDFSLKTAVRISKLLYLHRSPLKTMRISLDHYTASRSLLDIRSFQWKQQQQIL